MAIAYLGPAGTYTHEALLQSAGAFAGAAGPPDPGELVGLTTIHDVVMAVQDGRAEHGVVPIENSVEGSVNATLDALAFAAADVRIIGETVLEIHHCLIGPAGDGAPDVADVALVLSHPQALAQCAGFLRDRLPGADVRAAASTAEAVRMVAADDGPSDGGLNRSGRSGPGRVAALGPRTAAERYGGRVLMADVEDVGGNETRFAWLARADRVGAGLDADAGASASAGTSASADTSAGAGHRRAPGGPFDAQRSFKTAIAFWPRVADQPGWLVDCLAEFSSREVNMTRIESRPRKVGLGEYVFFIDLQGSEDDAAVAAGLRGVAAHVAQLRVLGSFPAA